MLAPPVVAAQTGTNTSRALTNWLTASSSFKKAGAFVGQGKYSQARAALSAGTTNLATPYKNLAAELLSQLDSTLKLSTNTADPRKRKVLVSLCSDLGAYEAAVRLQTWGGTNSSPEALADDAMYAWRLFDGGDTKAALAEYQRRLAKEEIDFWQQYFREQIRLLQERPATATNAQLALEAAREHYLKGLEARADLFGALTVLTRAAPHAKSVKEATPVYLLILRCLANLGDESGREAWQDRFLAEYKSEPEVCAMVYVDRAQKAYYRKDMNLSETLFRKVATDYARTSVYGDALYGLGLVLQDEQRYEAAMAEYARIFTSNANEDLLDLESSEDYPNYKFKAALRISECCEEMKDLRKALEYALLARDKYKFVSYCKDCTLKTRQNVEKRVKQLEQAVKEPAAPATVP